MTPNEQYGDKLSLSSGVCFTFEYITTLGFHWVKWNSFHSWTHGLHGLGECYQGLHQQSFNFGWACPLNYSRTMTQYHAAWAGIELTTLNAVYFYHNLVDKSENHTGKIKCSSILCIINDFFPLKVCCCLSVCCFTSHMFPAVSLGTELSCWPVMAYIRSYAIH